ncbi:MAG TPA: hypothetical protein VHB48_07390, partial [Chitinophagaceae bacterium]|nr:hypothetical protein [Chitinophagaceae bacterium]
MCRNNGAGMYIKNELCQYCKRISFSGKDVFVKTVMLYSFQQGQTTGTRDKLKQIQRFAETFIEGVIPYSFYEL